MLTETTSYFESGFLGIRPQPDYQQRSIIEYTLTRQFLSKYQRAAHILRKVSLPTQHVTFSFNVKLVKAQTQNGIASTLLQPSPVTLPPSSTTLPPSTVTLTLTCVMGMIPRLPSLFSARYQNTTLQGSMMVSTSPFTKGRS